MTDHQTSELGKAIQEVTETASLLVREEIALAKAEMTEKVSGLVKGAAVGAAAGIFIVAGLIYFLHFLALLIAELLGDNVWLGYLIVAGALFLFGGLAGFLAARFFKKGTPPTPQMAIEEAQLIKATLTAPHPATPEAVERHAARRRSRRSDERRALAGGDPALDRGQPRRARHRRGEAARRGRRRRRTGAAQLRAHKREVIIGAAVAGLRRSAAGSPRSPACSPAGAPRRYY